MINKKSFVALSLSALLVAPNILQTVAAAETTMNIENEATMVEKKVENSGLVLREENQDIFGENFTNLNDKVDELKKLDEGTIIIRFNYENPNAVMSLFSLSNSNLQNSHFHVYITQNSVGFENRYEEPGKPPKNTHVRANVNLQENENYTLAIVADKEEGYKFFLDGRLILHDKDTERKFLSNIYNPDSAQLGRTERAGQNDNYLFNGAIEFAEIYDKPLADEELVDEETEKDQLILREDNQQINGRNFTNLNDKVDELKQLDEGTIIVRFKYQDPTAVMSLFSLSNKNLSDGHYHVYVTPSTIGLENRYEKPGEAKNNTNVATNVNLKENEVYTLAIVMDQLTGYKFFLDGERILHDQSTARKFLSNIHEPNSAQLGRTERAGNKNNYHFNGTIDFAEVHGVPLSDEKLIEVTKVTKAEAKENPLPDDAKITDPYSVFYPGLYGSRAYRIPALYHTNNGTLLAGIDKRINGAADSPANIDMIVRRSLDQGDSWEDNEIMINDYPGNASNIDQLLLQDSETNRMYSMVVAFPEGGGFPTTQKGTGFVTVDGEQYMVLYDNNNNQYTVRDEGVVYDKDGQVTDYRVDEKRNLFSGEEEISNIFLNGSPLKVPRTSFLELWHSDDEGETWSGPKDLNPGLKEDWMSFLGVGPGNGIQLTEGEHKGRLVFPVYFTNENNSQTSAVVYSDDNGETWKRGESPNHGRVVNGQILDEKTFTGTGHYITESQAVEMPDGQIKMFMRNLSGRAQIATSFDGGATWDSEVITESDLVAPYSQMSAIRYDGLIDGKEAVIFSSASQPGSRVNGKVRVGLITEDGTHENGRTKYVFDWKYSQLVKEGNYGYSSLTNLENGDVGLLYENNTHMDFIKFNPEFLKWDRYAEGKAPVVESFEILTDGETHSAGDKIEIKVLFNEYIMLSGDQKLQGTIGTESINLELKEANKLGTEFVFEGIIPELDSDEYEMTLEFSSDLEGWSATGMALDKAADENKFVTTIKVGIVDPEEPTDPEETEEEAKRAAVLVDRMIYRLPNVRVLTQDDTELVESVRTAYDNLSDQAKTHVKYLSNLELREDRLDILNAEEEVADEFAVRELQRRIYRLPSARNITLADAEQVEAIREDYDALNDASKDIFSPQYLKNLELREDKLAVLRNNE